MALSAPLSVFAALMHRQDSPSLVYRWIGKHLIAHHTARVELRTWVLDPCCRILSEYIKPLGYSVQNPGLPSLLPPERRRRPVAHRPSFSPTWRRTCLACFWRDVSDALLTCSWQHWKGPASLVLLVHYYHQLVTNKARESTIPNRLCRDNGYARDSSSHKGALFNNTIRHVREISDNK